jgi:hypothetical protein
VDPGDPAEVRVPEVPVVADSLDAAEVRVPEVPVVADSSDAAEVQAVWEDPLQVLVPLDSQATNRVEPVIPKPRIRPRLLNRLKN